MKLFSLLFILSFSIIANERFTEIEGYVCKNDAKNQEAPALYGSIQDLGKVQLLMKKELEDKFLAMIKDTYCVPVVLEARPLVTNAKKVLVKSIINSNPGDISGNLFLVSKIGKGFYNEELDDKAAYFEKMVEYNKLCKVSYLSDPYATTGLLAAVTTALSESAFTTLVTNLNAKIMKPGETMKIQKIKWSKSRGQKFHLKR